MRKVIVIGCPGAGKSVFSIALHALEELPLFHLDRLYWNADKTTAEKAVFLGRLQSVLDTDAWIIDGNYASTMEMRMNACDTVFFLDYPVEVCLEGIRQRRGKPRPDMPWIEEEEDEELTAFVREYQEKQRPAVMALLERHREKQIIIFRSRREASDWLFRRTQEMGEAARKK